VLVRIWKSETLLPAGGAATMEDSMEVPPKVKNRTTLQSSNCTNRYLPKGNKNTNLKGYMHPGV